MNKTEFSFEQHLRKIFLEVQHLPESTMKSADFICNDNLHSYLIEFKLRKDDEDIRQQIVNQGHCLQFTAFNELNSERTILRDANKQLESSQIVANADFKVVWFWLCTSDNNFFFQQLLREVYGIQILRINKKQTKECYFYNESFFFRCKTVPAVVVESIQGKQCLLNPYCPIIDKFIDSSLSTYLKECLLDPYDSERRNEILIADNDGDRRMKHETVKYLIQKYKLEHIYELTKCVHAHGMF